MSFGTAVFHSIYFPKLSFPKHTHCNGSCFPDTPRISHSGRFRLLSFLTTFFSRVHFHPFHSPCLSSRSLCFLLYIFSLCISPRFLNWTEWATTSVRQNKAWISGWLSQAGKRQDGEWKKTMYVGDC